MNFSNTVYVIYQKKFISEKFIFVKQFLSDLV